MTMLSPHAYLKAARRLSSRFARKALEPDEQEEVLAMRRRRKAEDAEDEELAQVLDAEEEELDEETFEKPDEEDADLTDEDALGTLGDGFEELKQDENAEEDEDAEEVLAMARRRKRRRKAAEDEEEDLEEELKAAQEAAEDEEEELVATNKVARLASQLKKADWTIGHQRACHMAFARLTPNHSKRMTKAATGANGQPVLGREREENRRQIDAEVMQLRRANKMLSFQAAIRKVRARCPYLFA